MRDIVRGAVIPKISPHPLSIIGDRELRVLGLKPDFAGNLEDNKKVYDEKKPRSKPLYWLIKIVEHMGERRGREGFGFLHVVPHLCCF